MHNSETRRYMQELCSVLDDISEHADKGLDYTQKLVSVLGQINQNINNIERLANQTNLLAVNSAIEASHVGSRGAGFSVIAREIKQLSGEIQDEAINITTFTGKIKSHAKAIHTDAEDNQKLVSSIRDIAVQAEERLQDMITSSSRMEAIIRFVAVQQFLNTVKLDHVIWKGISTAACWTEMQTYRLMTIPSAVSANGITLTKGSGLSAMMLTADWKGRTG